MERLTRNAPALLLAAAAALAAVVTLAITRDLTFYGDTWELLVQRRDLSADAVLTPHNEHLVAVPVLIEQVLVRLFGMTSALPEYVLLTAILIATAVLLYVYVKRRLGPWPALFAAVLVLFFGPAWEVLLWPFEITFAGAMMCGLAALLLLEREDGLGDFAACVLLVLGLGFSGAGVPFVVGAFVAVLIGPRETWLRRSYVFVVPALLFAAWYVGWGHEAESHIGLRNLLDAPRAVADGIAAPLAGLFGLGGSPMGAPADLSWGRALLVALAIGLIVLKLRRPNFPKSFWPVAAAALASWSLTAFNLAPGRDPTASRYQYAGAIFILLLLANLLQGVRLSRGALVAAGAVTVLAVGPNLVLLHDGRDYFQGQTVLARSGTAAIEIAERTVEPGFQLNPERAGTPVLVNVIAQPYLEGVDEYGSPAYSVEELPTAPEPGRSQADRILAEALPITLTPERGTGAGGAGCPTVGGPGGAEEIELGPGQATVTAPAGAPATLSLRRFTEGAYPATVGTLAPGATAKLTIPADQAPQPWHLHVEAKRPATVCP